jgi:hypothetical protein
MPISRAFLHFQESPAHGAAILGNARPHVGARRKGIAATARARLPDTRFFNLEDVFFFPL